MTRGRPLAALGLVVVFAGSLAAGWAVADPGAFAGAIAAATGGTPAPTPAPTPPPPAASPGPEDPTPTPASPAPTAAPIPTASPTPTPAPEPTVPPAVVAKLDRALARAKDAFLLPGVEATVLFPDGTSWTGTLGTADVATGRPVRASTPFAIASVSKTFTAALVLRYVDDGRIGLDDPIARWLPDWPDARRITVRMLLNHTSGIPDFFKHPKIDAALTKAKKKTWTAADVLDAYVRPTPVFAPGAGWSYSNTNYVLLGVIAEEVGGAPWATLVHRELIDPLELRATYVQAVDQPPAPPARAYRIVATGGGTRAVAWTDGTDIVPFTSVVTAAGSSGALASTSGDLARWGRALYAGEVLSPATRREMVTFERAFAYGYATRYGLGVSRVKIQGRLAWGHTGALAGTRAAIRYFPGDGVTIAVLFNRDAFVGDDVVRSLARALFPTPAASPSPSPGSSAQPSAAP